MVTTDTAITVTRINIGGSGGTGTIIGTITTETMIETTTGIEPRVRVQPESLEERWPLAPVGQ
jgi:hypothetical protein